MGNEEKGLAPIDIGGGDMLPADEFMSAFADTMGDDLSPLDRLATYNQGKDAYWNVGKDGDDTVTEVFGILLFSQRPMRSWYPTRELSNNPPSCSSIDGKVPLDSCADKQSDVCDGCIRLDFKGGNDGEPCKKRAADFIFEVAGGDDLAVEDGIVQMDASDITGEALLRYSLFNKEGGKEWAAFARASSQMKRPPQGVLLRWGWQKGESRNGTKYSAIKLDVVGALPMPNDAPELWIKIRDAVVSLKEGDARAILDAFTAKPDEA